MIASSLRPSTEAKVIESLQAHLKSDDSRSSDDAVRGLPLIGSSVGQCTPSSNAAHTKETSTADGLSLEAVDEKRVGAKQDPEGTSSTSPTESDTHDIDSAKSSVDGVYSPQRRETPQSFAAAASVPKEVAAASEAPRADWAVLRRKP